MRAKYITPVVAIFDENGKIDKEGNCKVLEHLIKGGMDGIVIMGSTGEFFSMTIDEIKRYIDIAAECINHRVEFYVGTSRMIASETIELGNYALSRGADGVMIISPYYFPLTDESVEFYYDTVASGINGKIFLYNYPAITKHEISPKVALSLARKHNNIRGIKDTNPLIGHTRDLMNALLPEFPDFEVYNGFDESFGFVVESGGTGAIGGLSNLWPELFAKWVKAANEKDYETFVECQKTTNVLMGLYTIGSPYIPIMKHALNLRGLGISEYVTTPFIKCTDEQDKKLRALMKKVGLL
ncbi:MAG: dihydrodipicolinate synthase family protein [Clostridia bacterium]|nr:dihydrodipicolinate synthase family protein [Clostridia bacterium]MCI2000331.1 dihydrodipicolinate synthase family protein [Clostridia bacterium]MCI2015511.1 dihydrodipicolinate synthase family protein [Clostridia bacterium]